MKDLDIIDPVMPVDVHIDNVHATSIDNNTGKANTASISTKRADLADLETQPAVDTAVIGATEKTMAVATKVAAEVAHAAAKADIKVAVAEAEAAVETAKAIAEVKKVMKVESASIVDPVVQKAVIEKANVDARVVKEKAEAAVSKVKAEAKQQVAQAKVDATKKIAQAKKEDATTVAKAQVASTMKQASAPVMSSTLDPTSISVSAEYPGVCVGFFASSPNAPSQMAMCPKTTDDACPAYLTDACMILKPLGTSVTSGAKLMRF